VTLALLTDADRFPFDDEDRSVLAEAGVTLRELGGHDPKEVVAAARGAAVVFIYHAEFTREVIAQLDAARVLARCGTGYDNVDVGAAREHGIEVIYVPAYGADDVSDHTLALLLGCARRLAASDRAVRASRWPAYSQLGEMHRLRGRVLGLLGFGRIAREVARKAQVFGLRVVAHDPYVDQDVLAQREVTALPMAEVLRISDLVSVHVPFSGGTRHLIGEAELALMRPHAILVNTSRGALVDQAALASALAAGQVGGAGLDVFEREPPAADDALLQFESVILTPHSAAFSEESLAELRKLALADALGVLAGRPAENPAR